MRRLPARSPALVTAAITASRVPAAPRSGPAFGSGPASGNAAAAPGLPLATSANLTTLRDRKARENARIPNRF